MFLCVPVFVLDETLRNIFGTLRNVFGHFQILSDPTKNLGTLKIKNVTPVNYRYKNVGRYTNETNKKEQNLSITTSKCNQFEAGNSLEKEPLKVLALLKQNLARYMK